MKFITIVVLTLSAGFTFASGKPVIPKQSPVTKKTNKKTIQFLGSTLVLKEEKKLPQSYLAEYIPSAETFDNLSQMFAVWGSQDGSNALSQVKAKIQFVEARKGTDPVANYKLFQSDDKKSYGLDFLISEGNVIEHNVWYFTNVKGGVLAYQFARRNYRDVSRQPASDFIKEVPKVGGEALTYFKSNKFPRPAGYNN